MGSPVDFRNFMGAVIDESAWDTIMRYVDHARSSDDYELVVGGEGDKSKGYYISPTVFRSEQPRSKLMSEEIFGPVLTVFVYDDDRFEETLEVCDKTSAYALTGAVFGRDRRVLHGR